MIKTLATLFIGGAAGWHLARSRNAEDVAAVFSENDVYKIGYESGAKNVKRALLMGFVPQIITTIATADGPRLTDEEIIDIVSDELGKEED